MPKIFVLLSMIFLHIVDDYYLQGILASMKQKKWWKMNAPQSMYRYDYIMALVTHGFSWAFMIMIPVVIYYGLDNLPIFLFVIYLIINWIIHCIVDHAKANLFKINLICDQLIHLLQIIVTFLVFCEGCR